MALSTAHRTHQMPKAAMSSTQIAVLKDTDFQEIQQD
jgi:hypothetical protein